MAYLNDPALLYAAAAATFLGYQFLKKRPPAPLPPGPKGLPFLGNALDLPTSEIWIGFTKLAEKYGGIVYLEVMGNPIVVINDPKIAIEMLDKKSYYSERPVLTMAGKLVGWDEAPAIISSGDTWSEYRRLMAQYMGTRSRVESHSDILEDETRSFLKSLLADPKPWVTYARKFAGSLVLRLAYGYNAKDGNDPMIKTVDELMDQFSGMTTMGAYMVDILPSLRFVPEWFPGAGWKKKIPLFRKSLQETIDMPYNWTKGQMAAGSAASCFLTDLLEQKQRTPEEEHIFKWAAFGIYGGGADTTVAGIQAIVLALTVQVEAQAKARAELDRVLGPGHMPTLADRHRLPYIDAFISEVFRNYIIGPAGLPHCTNQDDIHDGYFIPKGTMVITNNWCFYKDPKTYKDPEAFRPERFLGDHPEFDTRKYLFGFGRRVCPGMQLAEASMWLLTASIVASYEISPPEKDGKPVVPSPRFSDGSISHPEEFDFVITPRRDANDLILNTQLRE